MICMFADINIDMKMAIKSTKFQLPLTLWTDPRFHWHLFQLTFLILQFMPHATYYAYVSFNRLGENVR